MRSQPPPKLLDDDDIAVLGRLARRRVSAERHAAHALADLRHAVRNALEAGASVPDVAQAAGISTDTCARWGKLLR